MLLVRFSLVFFLFISIGCTGSENSQKLSEFTESTVEPDSLKESRETELVQPSKLLLTSRQISPYDHIIKKYSRRYGFDWRLIAAQIFTESRFDIDARSHRGAMGLMQIMPGTAKHLGADTNKLLMPEQNIALGCFYDRQLFNLWKDKEGLNRLAFTLASYNAGRLNILRAENRASGGVQWSVVKKFAPRETQNYVGRIFGKYSEYKKKHF